MTRFFTLLLLALLSTPSFATIVQSHGYAQFGQLKYPSTFTHLDWVNPNAPKGGTVRIMNYGTFDTLNPYTIKGISPVASDDFLNYGVNELNATLMAGSGIYDPSGDEATSAYGLIAESLEYSQDRSWVTFNLRKEATFHDGTPITAQDVLFSYQILKEQAHPQYRVPLQEVDRVEVLNSHRVRFVFKRANNPLLILRIGEIPVLPKHYWEKHDFQATTFKPPLGSGPYRITQVKPGKQLTFERVPNWWGENLPINKGKYNFDKVILDFYRDRHVAFEAFKAGQFDIYIDHQAKNWATAYNFPAVRKEQIIRREITHQIPSQTQALFFNTRRTQFNQIEVRKALSLLFDFEWLNNSLFNQAYLRSTSYYPNSPFSALGLPDKNQRVLLQPWQDKLPKELFSQAFTTSTTDGRGLPRESIRQALLLLEQGGWKLTEQGLRNSKNQPFKLEILLVNPSLERVLQSYINNLRMVGIEATLRTVDRAQFKQRLDRYDYDLTLLTLPQSISPGLEQVLYFHSSQANVTGGKNYAGIQDPVVDKMLEHLMAAKTREQQINATQALDRVLLWRYYSIPNWHINKHRIAYWDRFDFVKTPPYALGLRAWWIKPEKQ
ncbi:extracellular solute-binding protein [Pseudomonas sp. F1_0610]|uniref:extracellular solute-binding protein n=1 Tax=Pseudomonas sp. F1_0610 TaxID=3114284 RepID=UPI0039C15A89